MRQKIFYLVISLALSISVLWSIRDTDAWYPMHDTTHIARVSLMEQTIRGGQFPPIWAEGINNGYGYPLFHFYAPIFYYTALIAKLITGTYITGLKLAILFYIFFGTYGIMKLASRWGRGAAILAGTAFVLSPYLALDLYVRGAFAEIAGMMLFPWVLISWEKLDTKKQAVIAGLTTALFLASHNLIPVIAFPVLGTWILINHYTSFKKVLLPALLTALISAFYWPPLIFERSFVQADAIARVTDYSLHFVYPTQIWNSTWGFGGSGQGIEDGLSFKMGKVQLLLGILGMAALVWRKQLRNLFLAAAAIFALFMSTTAASWIWDHLPFLAVIQFPWRYLSLAAGMLAASVGASVLLIRSRLVRLPIVTLAVCAIIFFNFKYFSPQWTFNDPETRYMNAEYLSTITSIIPEFMPRWMSVTPSDAPAHDLKRAYYPTWRAEQGLNDLEITPDERGVTKVRVTGDGEVRLYQSHTPLERLGYTLTLVGLVLSLYLWRKS